MPDQQSAEAPKAPTEIDKKKTEEPSKDALLSKDFIATSETDPEDH